MRESESERERERENILFVWRGFGWNYLIFKGVFLVDGDEWKKEVVNCWQQEIWAHQETEIECDWKILTCGSIRIYIFFWFKYSYILLFTYGSIRMFFLFT